MFTKPFTVLLHQYQNLNFMIKNIVFILLLSIQTAAFGTHKVYVIHGWASNRALMHKINKTLKKNNFITENYAYRSVYNNLDTLGFHLYNDVKNSGYDTVLFVTHSMGALVVRSMLQYSRTDSLFPNVYRIVMIAPPNNGAEIADFYSSFEILTKLIGPNVALMRTDSNSYARNLPVPLNSEVGIIAAMRKKERGYNPFINGNNDGLLTPARTTLGTETDFALVFCNHARVTQKKHVRNIIVAFLQHGRFLPM